MKKTATQSSTYNDLVAERATDGTWNSGTFPRRFCAQTIPSKAMAWLEIDLQQTYSIRRVKILYGIYGEKVLKILNQRKVRDES